LPLTALFALFWYSSAALLLAAGGKRVDNGLLAKTNSIKTVISPKLITVFFLGFAFLKKTHQQH
jgi:hypothetical protein